ncbi:MAG TPA: hypothetical protein VMZ27_14890 [Candidatus Saccharimonadales bacterium]|nr:hypothetical protein [Candidatus Saccharimonadales bacterium]
MSSQRFYLGIAFLILTTFTIRAGVSPKSTSGPYEYGFASDAFYADGAATNATITVGWRPANSSYCCGSVNFATADGTAVAGRDYAPASGVLNFSDPAARTFNVPLHPSTSTVDRTIRLRLTKIDSSCIISPSEVTLTILAPRPKLEVVRANDALRLSWPASASNYVVETLTELAPGQTWWDSVSQTPTEQNGQLTVSFQPTQASHFFRLRRVQ